MRASSDTAVSTTTTEGSREAARGLTLAVRLPLTIAALLLALTVLLSAAAYTEIRRTALRFGADRLTSVNTQLAQLLGGSRSQMIERTQAFTLKPEVSAFVKTPSAANRRAAARALEYTGPQADQVLAMELRDSTGRALLSVGAGTAGLATLPDAAVLRPPGGPDSVGVGRFRQLNDTLVFPVMARIPSTVGAYVVMWRRLGGTTRSRDQITGLIGSRSQMFLGNSDGSAWTDFAGIATAPALDVKRLDARNIHTYRRDDGRTMLASILPVEGTPWSVLLAFPRDIVLSPATAFVGPMLLIAVLALAAGVLISWQLSRQITGPLRTLTTATTTVAAGNYHAPVRVRRRDEIGQLADAFSVMAAEVDEARNRLEEKVAERTRELDDALRQLHDAQESLVRREKLAILGQLASGVGHELRNPLGVMTNAIYYLEAVLAGSPDNVREYLGILRQQVGLSERIVSDLLDFARVKTPQRQSIDVSALVDEQMRRANLPPDIKVIRDLPHDLRPAYGDSVQIGQVVLNLLTNAAQSLDEAAPPVSSANGHPTLTIRARVTPDERLELAVADNGPGVPPELAEKIFEPLFTTKARGIGLGLAVSRTLARANEGDLTLDRSGPGGATFTLTLPTGNGAP